MKSIILVYVKTERLSAAQDQILSTTTKN